MREKTKELIQKICKTNGKTTDEEYVELAKKATRYLYTLPEEESNEFAHLGYGEMLDMCCPPEEIENYERNYYLANYASEEEREEAKKYFGLDAQEMEKIIRENKDPNIGQEQFHF